MNDGREYRYQKDWSIDNQMFHVRCDEWDIFIKAVDNMASIIPTNGKSTVTSQPVSPKPIQQTGLGNCSKCGSSNAMSKNNKVYCSAKCWL